MMYAAVALGYLASVLAAFLLCRRLLAWMVRRAPGAERRRLIVRGGVAGGLVALLPALLLGTVVGGTLGGALGERLAPSGAGAAAALAFGQFAVACVTIVAFVTLGAMAGSLAGRGPRLPPAP